MRARILQGARCGLVALVSWVCGAAAGPGALAGEGEAPAGLEAPLLIERSLAEDAAGAVSVITGDALRALDIHEVTEALRLLPGVHADSPGGRGGVASVYVRGGEPNYTVVLIDGIVVNDPTNSRGGSFDFSLLGTEDIERIEVARGISPVAWGASAMAGTVNIITRRGGGTPRSSLDVSAGRDGYHREVFQSSGAAGEVDYFVSYSLLDEGVPVPGSEFASQSGSATLSWAASDRLRLRATARRSNVDRESFTDASGGPRFAPERAVEMRDTDLTLVSLRLTHEPTDFWSHELDYAFFDQREDLATPFVEDPANPFGSLPPSDSDSDFTRNNLRWSHRLDLGQGVAFRAGGDLLYERGSSRGSLDLGGFALPTDFSLDRDVVAPFAELDLRPLRGLRIQAGVRHDMPRGEDNELLPRVSLAYELGGTGSALHASWGRGHKLPSFFALAHPVVGAAATGTVLEAELSETVEAGVSQLWMGGRARAGLTWFYSEYENLIDFDFDLLGLVNRPDVVARGAELTAAVQPSTSLAISAHASYVDTDIRHLDTELRNRPEWRGGLLVRWRLTGELELTASGTLTGSSLDSSLPTGDRKLGKWKRLDLSASWSPSDSVRLYGSIRNVSDEDYEQFIGFPSPGTSARIGIQLRH